MMRVVSTKTPILCLSRLVMLSNAMSSSRRRRSFQMVVAATQDLGIGKDGRFPWNLPSDMAFFKKVTSSTSSPTKRNAVIMGRKTWESIPSNSRPLPGRLNVVLTRREDLALADASSPENLILFNSVDSALMRLADSPYNLSIETVFVIGGGQIFRETMGSSHCDAIHITEIESSFHCDTYMPSIDCLAFRLWYSSLPTVENNVRYRFATYVRVPPKSNSQLNDTEPNVAPFQVSALPAFILERHEEYQYLNLIHDIIKIGAEKADRTGTGTLSKFGYQMRFNLRNSFPLLTTKRVFGVELWRNCFGLLVVLQMPRCFKRRIYIFGMAMHRENI